MPKDLKEYIDGLRKYNAGITDAEVLEYLVSIGKSEIEVKSALGSLQVSQNEFPSVVQAPVVTSTPVVGGVPSPQAVVQTPIMSPNLPPQEIAPAPSFPSIPTPEPVVKPIEALSPAPTAQTLEPAVSINIDHVELPQKTEATNGAPAPHSFADGFLSSAGSHPFAYSTGNMPKAPQDKYEEAKFISETVIGRAKQVERKLPDLPKTEMAGSQNTVMPVQTGGTKFIKILIWFFVILLLGLLGVLGYFYKDTIFEMISKKPALINENIFETAFLKKSTRLQSQNVGAFDLAVPQADTGIKTFFDSYANAPEMKAFQNDKEKLLQLVNITNGLSGYFYKNKKYPKSLSDAALSLKDETFLSYESSDDQKDFLIRTSFESPDMNYRFKLLKNEEKENQIDIRSADVYVITGINADETDPLSISKTLSALEKSGDLSSETKIHFDYDGMFKKGNVIPFFNTITNLSFLGRDYSFIVSGEVRNVEEGSFIKFKRSPSFFGDFSKIKDKWVSVEFVKDFNASLGSQKLTYYLDGFSAFLQKVKQKKGGSFDEVIRTLDQVGFGRIEGEQKTVKTENGEDASEYTISLQGEKFPVIYEKVAKEFGFYDESVAEIISLPVSKIYLKYLFENFKLKLTVLPDGTLVKYTFSGNILLENEGDLKGKSLSLAFQNESFEIKDNISIEKPSEFLTAEQSYTTITSITEAEYRYQKQRASILQLLSSIKAYKTFTGSYPAALSDLLLPISIKKGSPSAAKAPLLRTLPQSIYPKTEILYTLDTKGDFSLSYYIENPKDFLKKENINFYVTKEKVISGLIVLTGQNTATETVLSKEAQSLLIIDTDKDLLSDSLEDFLGSNKALKDTDSDGFSDYSEFVSGGDLLKK